MAVLGASANRARMLRRAHAEVYRLRKEGGPLPFWLRVLEAEYQARVRKPENKAGRPAPDPGRLARDRLRDP